MLIICLILGHDSKGNKRRKTCLLFTSNFNYLIMTVQDLSIWMNDQHSMYNMQYIVKCWYMQQCLEEFRESCNRSVLTNVVAVKASLQMKIRRAHTLTSVMFISWTELLWQVFTAFFTCCILLPCYKGVDHITRKAENTEEGKQTKPCDINKTHMMKVVLKREIHLYFGIKANNL